MQGMVVSTASGTELILEEWENYTFHFYTVYIKRENADSWDSGLEKEQILETYSAQLQKS